MIDGHTAAQILLGYGDAIRPGYCLHYVWQAYKAHGARTDRSAPTALVGWERSDGKHPGDRNPPPGVPVWWGRRYDGNADGDVVISLGGGRVVATDWPFWGVVGITTIDEREAQISREYLGCTEAIFDVPVYAPPAPEPSPAPVTSEEDFMATDALELAWWGYLVGGATARFPSINTRSEKLASGKGPLPARVIIPASYWREMQKPFRIWHHLALPGDELLGMAAVNRPGRTAAPLAVRLSPATASSCSPPSSTSPTSTTVCSSSSRPDSRRSG